MDLGRVDGFIFAQEESDNVIRGNKYIRIKREFYEKFEVKFVIPKGKEGDEIDGVLTKAIRKIIVSGKHKELTETIHSLYNNWQPSETQ